MSQKRPPKHLAATEAKLWSDVVREFQIDDPAGLALWTAACEAAQLAREAREVIEKEGLMPGGKPHPLLLTVRDARKAFGALLRQLSLDLEPERPLGRPPRPLGISHDQVVPLVRKGERL